jgi:glycosyltransferase involved in cell wall biosynthesis
VGQVSTRKGIPHLLAAWEQLNWQDSELLLAGAISLPAEVQQRYRHLANVRFLGYAPNPLALFQQADIFVFPSLAEGSALVTYEALACGLPIITTFNSGSIVEDGREGFIIPIRDAQVIAGKLEHLRSDHKLRQQMAEAARIKANLFSWDRYGDRLVQSLKSLPGSTGSKVA